MSKPKAKAASKPKAKAVSKAKAMAVDMPSAKAKAVGKPKAKSTPKAKAKAAAAPEAAAALEAAEAPQAPAALAVAPETEAASEQLGMWSDNVYCATCKMFVSYKKCRVLSKTTGTWRCSSCSTKMVQLRRLHGSWPTAEFSMLTEVR